MRHRRAATPRCAGQCRSRALPGPCRISHSAAATPMPGHGADVARMSVNPSAHPSRCGSSRVATLVRTYLPRHRRLEPTRDGDLVVIAERAHPLLPGRSSRNGHTGLDSCRAEVPRPFQRVGARCRRPGGTIRQFVHMSPRVERRRANRDASAFDMHLVMIDLAFVPRRGGWLLREAVRARFADALSRAPRAKTGPGSGLTDCRQRGEGRGRSGRSCTGASP